MCGATTICRNNCCHSPPRTVNQRSDILMWHMTPHLMDRFSQLVQWLYTRVHFVQMSSAFIPMTCHRWLMVLFPMTKSKWQVTKSWLLGWPKLCWFQLYCSKTIWSISLIFPRHITRYIHIILTIFQEATECLTLWIISLENFCKNFFPGV